MVYKLERMTLIGCLVLLSLVAKSERMVLVGHLVNL